MQSTILLRSKFNTAIISHWEYIIYTFDDTTKVTRFNYIGICLLINYF